MLTRPIFAVALLGFLAVPAWANDPQIPPRDPLDHPRVIRLTDHGSTSKCIGGPATPACAVEQVIVAKLRGDINLWAKAMSKDAPYHDDLELNVGYGDHAYYRYVSGKRLSGDLIKDWGARWEELRCTDMMDEIKPGDLRLDVQYKMAWSDKPERLLNEKDVPTIFVLRHIKPQKWLVVDYCHPRIENEEDMFWLHSTTTP